MYSTPFLNNLISLPAASKVISLPESITTSSTAAIVKRPAPVSVSVAKLAPSPDIDIEPASTVRSAFIVAAPLE